MSPWNCLSIVIRPTIASPVLSSSGVNFTSNVPDACSMLSSVSLMLVADVRLPIANLKYEVQKPKAKDQLALANWKSAISFKLKPLTRLARTYSSHCDLGHVVILTFDWCAGHSTKHSDLSNVC